MRCDRKRIFRLFRKCNSWKNRFYIHFVFVELRDLLGFPIHHYTGSSLGDWIHVPGGGRRLLCQLIVPALSSLNVYPSTNLKIFIFLMLKFSVYLLGMLS